MPHETSAEPTTAPASACWCVYVDGTMQVPGGYRPAVITKATTGYVPLGEGGRGWVWGPSVEQAKSTAREFNTSLGLTEADIAAIIASSMAT